MVRTRASMGSESAKLQEFLNRESSFGEKPKAALPRT